MAKKRKKTKRKAPAVKKRKAPAKRKGKKTRTKGIQYIAKALVKYFKNKYPTYNSALPKAREIFEKLKGKDEKGRGRVNIKNIFELERKHRTKKPPGGPPFVPPEMFEIYPFFEPGVLESDYPKWISEASNLIEFRSNISPSGNDVFKGGSNVSYDTHFKAFCDYCNRMFKIMRENGEEVESPDGALFTTSIPKLDKKTNQWFCEISSCDIFGEDQDYGFDKNNPETNPTSAITPSDDPSSISTPQGPIKPPGDEKPKPPGDEKPIPPGPTKDLELEKLRLESQERIKKAEIESSERIKQEKLSNLKELLKDKVISFDEYLRALKEI